MLERVRATALALLGATAAVGLALVAIAANQGWPLIEGSPIPPAPREHLGGASVVARAERAARPRPVVPTRRGGRGGARHGRHDVAGAPARTHSTAQTPSGGEEATALVVSQKTPAKPSGGESPKAPPAHGKTPESPSRPTQTAAPTAPTSSPPPSQPAPTPTSTSTPTPAPVPAPDQPEAVASEAPPEESSVPSWSNGRGHAYGRDESRRDAGTDGYGDQGHSWDRSRRGYGD